MTTFKVVFVAYFWVILFSGNVVINNAFIGINWGRKSQTQMVPSVVVDLLLQNEIKAVKLLGNDDDLIRAFGGTDIELSLTIQNFTDSIKSVDDASQFVLQKIKAFPTVKFKYVVILNNAIADLRFRGVDFNRVVEALQYMQSALDSFGFGHIKATITHAFTGVLWANNTIPSDADFTGDTKNDTMPKILQFLNRTGAPFLFDIFPIAYLRVKNLDINYGFFDNKSTYTITDTNSLVYRNIFDFVHDSFVWAIKKLGYDNIKIGVGMIGWPTDGWPNANVETAERFWRGMLPLAASNRGTPMRPGAPIDIFANGLSDEKLNFAGLPFARHWGIYRSNGEPKYKIDLSGQGRDIYPTSAKGINLMPDRWCVFNKDNHNMTTVKTQYDFACNASDCTTMAPGGSCSMLTADERISYAFNSYFQTNYQDERSCDFFKLGKVTVLNPSRDGCVFTIEVVKNSQQPEISSF